MSIIGGVTVKTGNVTRLFYFALLFAVDSVVVEAML